MKESIIVRSRNTLKTLFGEYCFDVDHKNQLRKLAKSKDRSIALVDWSILWTVAFKTKLSIPVSRSTQRCRCTFGIPANDLHISSFSPLVQPFFACIRVDEYYAHVTIVHDRNSRLFLNEPREKKKKKKERERKELYRRDREFRARFPRVA